MPEFNRNDLAAGLIPALELPGGVTVPPGARVNSLTLAEHQAWNVFNGKKPLSEDEARLVGHREAEIAEFFGPPAT